MNRVETDSRGLVSIIIVLYNSADYIEACLESISRLDYGPMELVLVDNDSSDGSASIARECARASGITSCLISRLERNRGFAAACNHALSLSDGGLLLMLNPDTEVYPSMVTELVDTFESESIGIAGCKVLYPGGEVIQHAGGFVRDNGLAMHYGYNEEDEGQHDALADVPYVTGAALMVRRDVFTRAGMLDEGYFPAYFEETELCLKARRLGYRVVYVPGARVIHYESTTTGKFSPRYLYLFHKNRIRYMLKNYSVRFLFERALPFEQMYLDALEAEEQLAPLGKAYLANLAILPRTLIARWRMERLLGCERIEDTVCEL